MVLINVWFGAILVIEEKSFSSQTAISYLQETDIVLYDLPSFSYVKYYSVEIAQESVEERNDTMNEDVLLSILDFYIKARCFSIE